MGPSTAAAELAHDAGYRALKFGDRDALPRLLDVPVSGHSESHSGLQVADWLASAPKLPMVSHRHAHELEEAPTCMCTMGVWRVDIGSGCTRCSGQCHRSLALLEAARALRSEDMGWTSC